MEHEIYDPSDISNNFRILKQWMLKNQSANTSQVANAAVVSAYANLTAVEAEIKGGATLAQNHQIEKLKRDSFDGAFLNQSHHGNAQHADAFANLVRAQISLGKLTP